MDTQQQILETLQRIEQILQQPKPTEPRRKTQDILVTYISSFTDKWNREKYSVRGYDLENIMDEYTFFCDTPPAQV